MLTITNIKCAKVEKDTHAPTARTLLCTSDTATENLYGGGPRTHFVITTVCRSNICLPLTVWGLMYI